MDKIKFGLIGCGRISYKHVQALIDNCGQVVPVGFCDPIEERAQEKIDQYHDFAPDVDIKLYKDDVKMMDELDLDAVAICTESGYHGRIALDALERGLHVLIEKPMAMTLEEIDAINKLADEKNLKVAVAHQNRFNPAVQKLRRAVEEGRFGKILSGTARILWNRNDDYYAQAPWRGTRDMDGGTLMNQGIHNVDLLQWMLGSEVQTVKSEMDTFLRPIEMEDYGAIIARFKSGAIGIVEGSACVYPRNLEETLSIFGERGTAVLGGLAVNEVQTWNFEDERDYDIEDHAEEVDSVYGSGHTPLYEDFFKAISEDSQPLINGHEARKSVEIILKAYEDSGI